MNQSAEKDALATAFDEGMWAAYTAERDGGDGSEVRNPYRTACDHEWVDIPDPGGYVGRECKHCGINMDNAASNAIASRLTQAEES